MAEIGTKKLSIIGNGSTLTLFHDVGPMETPMGVRSPGQRGTFILAIGSPLLKGGAVTIKGDGTASAFYDDRDPREGLKQAFNQIKGASPGGAASPEQLPGINAFLVVQNGQAQFKFIVSSDSPWALQLPAGDHQVSFQTSVVFLDTQAQVVTWEPGPQISIMVTCRGPLPTFPYAFAIDVGTTNTCAAVMYGRPLRPVSFLFDNQYDSIPTLLEYKAVQDKKREYEVGVTAARSNVDGDPRRFVRGMKRYLGLEGVSRKMKIFVDGQFTELRPEEAYHDFVSRFLSQFKQQMRHKLRTVKATYPPDFRARSLEAIRGVYQQLEVNTDSSKLFGIDEASAAAVYYIYRRLEEFDFNVQRYSDEYGNRHTMLVFDVGGGTTDISLVEAKVDRVPQDGQYVFILRLQVLGCASLLHTGGDNFTLEVLKAIKCRIALAAAEQHGSSPPADLPDAVQDAIKDVNKQLSKFKALLAVPLPGQPPVTPSAADMKELEGLAELIIPTAWADFEKDGNAARNRTVQVFEYEGAMYTFQILWKLAERYKVRLAEEEKVTMAAVDFEGEAIPYSSLTRLGLTAETKDHIELNREVDLYRRITPSIQEAARACRLVTTGPDGEKRSIDHIQLVGNSCKLGLIRTLIEKEFRELPGISDRIEYDDKKAKSSVALGACLAAHTNTLGAGTELKIKFEQLEDQLGWEIGEYNAMGNRKFVEYFRATDRPSQKPKVLLQASDQPVMQLFRRRPVKGAPPEFMGEFHLDDVVQPSPAIEPTGPDRMRLHLMSRDDLWLVKGQRVYRMYKPAQLDKTLDPFSGIH